MKTTNLGRRALVALFGIPLIIACLYFGNWLLVAFVLVVNGVSQYEFLQMAKKKGAHPQFIPGILVGILIPPMYYVCGLAVVTPLLILSCAAFCIIELFKTQQNSLLNVATTTMSVVYPAAFFSFLIFIREFPKVVDIPYKYGGALLIAIIAMIWVCDTAAYFIGRAIGRHKLYYRVSPNKTMEGAIGGFVGAVLVGIGFYLIFPEMITFRDALVLGVGIGILSQIGDLIESVFKRDAGVKDSSSILPGHGGFLDRFDAPTYLAPLIYFYLLYVVY